jgi:phage gp45-like
MIERLANRIKSIIGVGRSTTSSQEAATATVQVAFVGTANGGQELRDGVPVMQQYGIASATLPGCDYAVTFISGDKTKGVAVASNDRRYRPTTLKAGEVMVHDNLGRQIYLSAAGIVINGNGAPVTINANVQVNGTITATGDIVGNGHSLSNHVHGGVQAGSSTTSKPQG